mmetsp:Transcript_9444/g.15439  ORF Transcript_9444/g.15439 Transcript_9444/m.15439 type:complete len:303 (-) Transcript_9444:1794-2702(-)|eukprot:CAMPEP_0203761622 /NCGR_PEP_ID=MMETSP0098-20131031/14674_1 /ASSEMBLY_ACC=CAM_ASM_000208 /TAXON_ID=96639 /ORGANISM=" , Strain NY0313808BC1" /LENGTH=302 /DNA_ID=CAMNT_0050655697 /DNA_START=608 /DNA_END=1516 /DNA_ORIENTATION=+
MCEISEGEGAGSLYQDGNDHSEDLALALHLSLQLELDQEEDTNLKAASRIQSELDMKELMEECQEEYESWVLATDIHVALNSPKHELEKNDEEIARELHAQLNPPVRDTSRAVSYADVLRRKGTEQVVGPTVNTTRAPAHRTNMVSIYNLIEDCSSYLESDIRTAFALRRDSFAKARIIAVTEPQTRARLKAEMERINAEAARHVFNFKNQHFCHIVSTKKKSLEYVSVDLHYLLVKEAVERVEQVLALAKKWGWKKVEIVCGAGTNSSGNQPRLAPQVKKLLSIKGKKYTQISTGTFLVIV